jgi:iron complex outermembrane recepter protein
MRISQTSQPRNLARNHRLLLNAGAAGIALALVSAPIGLAHAQDAEPSAERDSSEIIVTARKRQESILKVPVVVTAISGAQLENLQVTQVTDLPRLVPGLVLGGNLLSIGPQVTIRGVGTSSSDPGVDQSVSLNIDGLSLGQGLAFGSGMFDVAQVEVLKGPQALFYGKSSPGGVISLRTADPGSEAEFIARLGYEFEARQPRGELIVSGPVSDELGLRLATTYSRGEGYFRNFAEPVLSTGARAPRDRETQPVNFIIRGTALWEPSDAFTIRLKANHSYDYAVNAETAQLANCPDGPGQSFGFGGFGPALGLSPVDPIPFIGGDDCRLDRDLHVVYMDPAFFPGVVHGGTPYLENKQDFGTLELTYDLLADLTLTSTTGLYRLRSSSQVNTSHTTAAGPAFAVRNTFERDEFTQELRLDSDFNGALNFTLGGFYQDGRLYDRVRFIRNTAYGFLSPEIVGADILNDDRASTVDIKTYSLFGQARYEITPQLELAGGVRWTDEARSLSVFDFQNNFDLTPFLPRSRVQSSTFSPEATITYTPTDDLTVFGSYKKGFKSGSFSVATAPTAVRDPMTGAVIGASDNSFDDEKVQGYEIGVKSRLLDRSLLVNVAFYDYRYRGLQVGGIEPTVGGVPIIRTVNAGKARTYGIDFDLSYRPPSIEGLDLNASVNWNKARYTELNNIPCYSGQTVAQGCTTFFGPFPATAPAGRPSQANPGPGAIVVGGLSGYNTGQDLSGTPMIRAPEWTANFGFNYEMPVGKGMRLQFTNNNQVSSRFARYLALGRPDEDNFQDGFIKIDASIALKGEDDRWEVALIGKNITDKLTASNCSASNFAGGLVLGSPITGGTSSGPAGFAETGCYTDTGRSVWLRFTFRPQV